MAHALELFWGYVAALFSLLGEPRAPKWCSRKADNRILWHVVGLLGGIKNPLAQNSIVLIIAPQPNFLEPRKMAEHIQKETLAASGAADLRGLLLDCGWSARWVAVRVGASEGAGARWLAGVDPVPAVVIAWLRAVVVALEVVPCPLLSAPRRSPGRPRGGSYVLEVLRWGGGGPASVREVCDFSRQFGREVALITMRQNLERLAATGQLVRLDGSPVRYALRD